MICTKRRTERTESECDKEKDLSPVVTVIGVQALFRLEELTPLTGKVWAHFMVVEVTPRGSIGCGVRSRVL